MALDKLEGPVPCLKFLGFELDSRSMVIRLPAVKLAELQKLIQDWQDKKSSTKKELESLAGKLTFASRVVRPGKTFLRRMFELISVARQGHHHIRLNLEFRSDLRWWAMFLQAWNGVSILEQYGLQSSEFHICIGSLWLWSAMVSVMVPSAVASLVSSTRVEIEGREHYVKGNVTNSNRLCCVGSALEE